MQDVEFRMGGKGDTEAERCLQVDSSTLGTEASFDFLTSKLCGRTRVFSGYLLLEC